MDQVQYPGPNVWFHIRMNILFFSLWVVDMVMLGFAVESILTHGMGGIVLFASEVSMHFILHFSANEISFSTRSLLQACSILSPNI